MDIRKIKEASDPLFDKFWEVYEYSFPQHEKRTRENQIRAIEQQNSKIEAFLIEDEFIGFLIYWEFDTFIYAEHLALAKEVRSKGHGSAILSAFINRHSEKVLVLDIDPIVDDITERRRNFYFRLGFVQNSVHHLHPPYSGVDGERFELLLMTHSRELREQEFRIFKDALYNKIITY